MRRLWVTAMLLVMAPVWALAAPETPYAPETVMRIAGRSEGVAAVLEVLYPAVRGTVSGA